MSAISRVGVITACISNLSSHTADRVLMAVPGDE